MELKEIKKDASEILEIESKIEDLELTVKLKKETLKREINNFPKSRVLCVKKADNSESEMYFVPITESGEAVLSSLPRDVSVNEKESLYKDKIPQLKTIKEGIDYEVFSV